MPSALALTNAQVALTAAAAQNNTVNTIYYANQYLAWLNENQGMAGADAHL
jgi:hypothetical protein